jgi:hypothetical protein
MLAIDVQHGLSDAWDRIATFVPKLVGFLVIVVVGYVLAKALSRLVDSVLGRIGFDGWVERGGLRGLERVRLDASDVLAVTTFWAVFLIALQLAMGVFGPNPMSDLLEGSVAYLPNVFVAVVIVVIAAALGKAVTGLLGAALGEAPAGPWIARGAGLAIFIFGVFGALNQLHIAPAIVQALYYAILAVVVGVSIVTIGTGGIRTMHRYWERASSSAEATAGEIKRELETKPSRVEVEEDSIAVLIDPDADWKPPRARGYELGAPSN